MTQYLILDLKLWNFKLLLRNQCISSLFLRIKMYVNINICVYVVIIMSHLTLFEHI